MMDKEEMVGEGWMDVWLDGWWMDDEWIVGVWNNVWKMDKWWLDRLMDDAWTVYESMCVLPQIFFEDISRPDVLSPLSRERDEIDIWWAPIIQTSSWVLDLHHLK